MLQLAARRLASAAPAQLRAWAPAAVHQATTGWQAAAWASTSGASHDRGSTTPTALAAGGLLLGAAAVAASAPQIRAHADAEVSAPDPYARPPPKGHVPKEVVLYQYEVCPFCCKVKAFLDFYKLPYRVVEVNPLTKTELKSWSDFKKVPVVKLDDGEVLSDSSFIISRLAAELEAAGKATPPGGGGRAGGRRRGGAPASAAEAEAEERRWRQWVDERLVRVVTANIYRSWDESWQTFSYITEQTKWAWGTQQLARTSGAVLMWRIGKGMPAKYGLEGDIRQVLYTDTDSFVDALAGRDFLGGSSPNLADLAVFGVLRAVQGTDTYSDLLAHTRIGPWLMRMARTVGASARLPAEEE